MFRLEIYTWIITRQHCVLGNASSKEILHLSQNKCISKTLMKITMLVKNYQYTPRKM